MKLFILAFVAISVGFSESKSEDQNNGAPPAGVKPQDVEYTNAQALEKYFNVKTKDLQACNNDLDLENNKEVTSTLTALSKANKSDSSMKSADFQNILRNIAKAALPCADDNRVNAVVNYYNNVGSKKT